jgi:hypothetical protein
MEMAAEPPAVQPLIASFQRIYPDAFAYSSENATIHPIPGIILGEKLLTSPFTTKQAEDIIPLATRRDGADNLWEFKPSEFSITNNFWNESLEECIHGCSTKFGCKGEDTLANLDRLVIQGAGCSSFEPQTPPGSDKFFGYLVVQIPSIFTGGLMEATETNGTRKTYTVTPGQARFCVHAYTYLKGALRQATPIDSGYRAMLIYSLHCDPDATNPPPTVKSLSCARDAVAKFLREWSAGPAKIIIVPLKAKAYPPFYSSQIDSVSTHLIEDDVNIGRVLDNHTDLPAGQNKVTFGFANFKAGKQTGKPIVTLAGPSEIGPMHISLSIDKSYIASKDQKGNSEAKPAKPANLPGSLLRHVYATSMGKFYESHDEDSDSEYNSEPECECDQCLCDDEHHESGYFGPYSHMFGYPGYGGVLEKQVPCLVIYTPAGLFQAVLSEGSVLNCVQIIRRQHFLHTINPEQHSLDSIIENVNQLFMFMDQTKMNSSEDSLYSFSVLISLLGDASLLKKFISLLLKPETVSFWYRRRGQGSRFELQGIFESFKWEDGCDVLFKHWIACQKDTLDLVIDLTKSLINSTRVYAPCLETLRAAILARAPSEKRHENMFSWLHFFHSLKDKEALGVLVDAILLNKDVLLRPVLEKLRTRYTSTVCMPQYFPLRRLVIERAAIIAPLVSAGPPAVPSWARPNVRIDGDPELQDFVHSEEISFTKEPFQNIVQARRYAKRYSMVDVLMEPHGRGSNAVVYMQKVVVGSETLKVYQAMTSEQQWLNTVLTQRDHSPTPPPVVKAAVADKDDDEPDPKKAKIELAKVKAEPLDD